MTITIPSDSSLPVSIANHLADLIHSIVLDQRQALIGASNSEAAKRLARGYLKECRGILRSIPRGLDRAVMLLCIRQRLSQRRERFSRGRDWAAAVNRAGNAPNYVPGRRVRLAEFIAA